MAFSVFSWFGLPYKRKTRLSTRAGFSKGAIWQRLVQDEIYWKSGLNSFHFLKFLHLSY